MRTVPTVRVGRTVHHSERSHKQSNECAQWVLGLIFGIAVPIWLISQEWAYRNEAEAFSEAERSAVPLKEARTGDVTHFAAGDIESLVSDSDFGVSIPGALRLTRNTEYCQWEETSHTKCERCHDELRNQTVDCNCATTYYYVKTWRSHRILSTVFDQPGAHHNPQRDPYPSVTFTADPARATVADAGKVLLVPALLEKAWAPWRRVDWTLRAVPPRSWWQRWWPWPDTTRYEDIAQLRGAESSRAARSERFSYVGQGGYFFSPYQASTAGTLFNYFVQYLEGSLLDWQLGDLMPSCTAGDIRVFYTVQDPEEVSVVGKVLRAATQDEAAWVGLFKSARGHEAGMLHAGDLSLKAMADAEIRWHRQCCLAARLALAPWAYFVARRLGWEKAAREDRWWCGAAGLWGLSLGALWVALWGPGLRLQLHALATPVLLCLSAAALSQVLLKGGARPGPEQASEQACEQEPAPKAKSL